MEHQKGVKEAPTVGTKPGTSTSRKQIIQETWTRGKLSGSTFQMEWINFLLHINIKQIEIWPAANTSTSLQQGLQVLTVPELF